MTEIKSLNRYPITMTIEFFDTATQEFGEEEVTFHIYADQDFFQKRNQILEAWEAANTDKELDDYTVTNQAQYNEWLATQR